MTQVRAELCVHYLITKGIDSARLVPKGWGATRTLPGCSEADIAKMKTQKEKDTAEEMDRRVEFRILSFEYKKQ